MRKLWTGGTIYTMESNRTGSLGVVEAILTENGRVLAVGSYSDLKLLVGVDDFDMVDLSGGVLFPGWIDNHLHVAAHGIKLQSLDLTGSTSPEDMADRVASYASDKEPGSWIVGQAWDENQFRLGGLPTRELLDRAVPNHPVFLTRVCNHAYVANTMAFERVGISKETSDPDDGAYGRDPSTGELNGMIYEQASLPFKAAIPKLSREERKQALRTGVRDALRHGITSVHTEDVRELGGFYETWQLYREVIVDEGLRLRSNLLIYYPELPALIESGMTAGDGDEFVTIGAIKMFADGAMGGRTAFLSQPYSDAPHTRGTAILTQEELEHQTRLARGYGMPIAVHAIGDAAAERVITAMERYPVKGHRDRLIHGQVLRTDLIERLQKLHVAVDIQPRFVASDFPWVLQRLGEERMPYAYAWRKMLKAGLLLGGGSDAPIEPIAPMLGIHAAMKGYFPEQQLTPEDAIRLFTIGGTYATGEEAKKGTIAPGKWADFTVVSKDPFTTAADEWVNGEVTMTVIDGEIVYRG